MESDQHRPHLDLSNAKTALHLRHSRGSGDDGIDHAWVQQSSLHRPQLRKFRERLIHARPLVTAWAEAHASVEVVRLID